MFYTENQNTVTKLYKKVVIESFKNYNVCLVCLSIFEKSK